MMGWIDNAIAGIGGALLSEESLSSETKKMVGSTFICEAKDIDE